MADPGSIDPPPDETPSPEPEGRGPPDPTEAHLAALLAAADRSGAATVALRHYGPGILGYLCAVLRDDVAAGEAFSVFSEDLWRGISGFRGESTLRVWAYRLAWHAAMRHHRDGYRRRSRPLLTGEAEAIAVEIRSSTAVHLRDTARDALATLRAGLTLEENALLVLRIDRKLSWGEIADGLTPEGGERPAEATLRKRFERLTERLRREATARGLLKG